MNYLQNHLYNYLDDVSGLLVDYVDVEYGRWLTWLLTPLIITFLLPAVLIVLIYTSAVIFHVYRLYRRLRLVEGVQGDWRNAARLAVCALWDAHGWLWHGYEISGLENIPEGPCLFIYYHGALPVDMYYFIGRMYLLQRRLVHTVADRFMFKIPGWSIALDNLCVIPGTVQSCSGILRAGSKLAISPGGVYEAQFGDHRYQLNWKSRIGFAKVALEAKVPIVPLFTQNVREAFRTVGWLRWLWLRIYSATRIPLAPVYGGFPVKLTTHVGRPIGHDAALTPQQLQIKVARAVEELIEEHQRIPGSILRALVERVYRAPKKTRRSSKAANGSAFNGTLPSTLSVDADSRSEAVKGSEKYADRNGSYMTEAADDKAANKGDEGSETGNGTNGTVEVKNEIVEQAETKDDVSNDKSRSSVGNEVSIDRDEAPVDNDDRSSYDNNKLSMNINGLTVDKDELASNKNQSAFKVELSVDKHDKSVGKNNISNDNARIINAKEKANAVVNNIISELIDKVSEIADKSTGVDAFHERNVGEGKIIVS